MPAARMPFVGRREEMAALEDEFARAAVGEFRVVLLSGEAGVGKSRLSRELLARHPEAAGMFARAHPLGVTAAFGVWAEAIDPLLRDRSDAQVTAACGGLLDDLASLFHRVAVIRGSLPDREPPLPRLLQGLAALLRNLAAQAAVIAVLDDMHFADASSGEALRYFARHLDDTRAAAELAWGVKVINIYGTSEGGGTGVGCDRGSTHISEDQLIVEPVDLAGRAVLPGERAARIYLTNLYNPVLPLIRFEITDEVTVRPGPCRCGSAHRRIADVQGRLDDVFTYQGRRVHPHLFRTALGREAGIVEYQVRQTPAGAAIAVRCSAPVSLDGLRDRIAIGLAGAGLERPQVTVELVDRFERPGGPAKLKRFIPLEAVPRR